MRLPAVSGPMVVYICHPYQADPDVNAQRVRGLCGRLVHEGYLPLASQLFLPQFLDEPTERDLALRCCLRMVALADELYVYGEPTEGMKLEIAEANPLGIPVINCTKEGKPR